MRNPKESSYCSEATVGLNLRTVNCPQDSLRTRGPRTGDSPPSRYSTTPFYNSALQLRETPRDFHFPHPRPCSIFNNPNFPPVSGSVSRGQILWGQISGFAISIRTKVETYCISDSWIKITSMLIFSSIYFSVF